jgi:hypothetical protein
MVYKELLKLIINGENFLFELDTSTVVYELLVSTPNQSLK